MFGGHQWTLDLLFVASIYCRKESRTLSFFLLANNPDF